MSGPAHEDRAHAWASPSKLDRVLACPACAPWEASLPPEVRDPKSAAGKGEAIHEKAEAHLRSWTDPTADDPDAIHLVPYLAAVRAAAKGGALLLVEERVDIAAPDCFGTFDAAVVDEFDKRLTALDLKTGGQPVDPVENIQLGAYAAGLLAKYAGKPAAWGEWTVTLVICQAAGLDGGEAVRGWETTGAWCAALLKRIKAALRAARKPAPVPVAGGHCQWCKAAAVCPARLAQAAQVFPMDAGAQVITPGPVAPALLAPEVLSRVLGLADDIEAWLKACREHARAYGCPGWKLVEGRRGARRWIDEEVAQEMIARAGRIPYGPPPLKSPTEIEKEVGKSTFAESFASIVEQADGKPSLVREDDPRPAISSASVFPSLPGGITPGDFA